MKLISLCVRSSTESAKLIYLWICIRKDDSSLKLHRMKEDIRGYLCQFVAFVINKREV